MSLKLWREAPGKNWQIKGTAGGTRVRESTFTANKDRAESIRLQKENELENSRVYGASYTATVAKAINVYLDAGGEEKHLLPILDHFGPDKLLRDIDQNTLNNAANALYPGTKASTRNRNFFTPFMAAWNAAAEAGLCPEKKWRRPKGYAKKTKFRWLWPDELEAVWLAAPPHGRILLDTFAGSGLREAEGVGLDFADIRLDLAQLWAWNTKDDDPRRVELPQRTVSSIQNALHRKGPVLLGGGGAPYVLRKDGGGALKNSLDNWARAANVEPFGAHVLRHTFATWFYSQTRDIVRLQTAGGWSTAELAMRYTHLAPKGLDQELRQYGWDFRDLYDGQEIDRPDSGAQIIRLKSAG